jgi:hypothetical protein
MMVERDRLINQRLLRVIRFCGMAVLALALVLSSAGCGRKGPLKPLQQRSSTHAPSEML